MRALVCPDKFRGSMTAFQAARHIGEGCRDAGLTEVLSLPLADGGEGTLEIVRAARGGRVTITATVDALGRPVSSSWCLLPDGTAIVEAATSIGLALLDEAREPMIASSAGVGRVIARALDAKPRRLVVAVGGVASTDGGLGAVEELDWDLRGVETIVACDVTTILVDSARRYGPQKGANPSQVEVLSQRLKDVAELYGARAKEVSLLPGGGAAGGLAAGLAALGASLKSGFQLVSNIVGLEEHIRCADIVVTGEGRLDPSTLEGKVVHGVMAHARRNRKPVVVLAGAADEPTAALLRQQGTTVSTLRELAVSEADSIARAPMLLRSATRDSVRLVSHLSDSTYR